MGIRWFSLLFLDLFLFLNLYIFRFPRSWIIFKLDWISISWLLSISPEVMVIHAILRHFTIIILPSTCKDVWTHTRWRLLPWVPFLSSMIQIGCSQHMDLEHVSMGCLRPIIVLHWMEMKWILRLQVWVESWISITRLCLLYDSRVLLSLNMCYPKQLGKSTIVPSSIE